MSRTNVKPFVFVLMPFQSDFDDIYHVGIKAACQSMGVYCERVDEQIFTENILDRVYNQISKADIIIAEMTGRNPNVFYETGYAHALNKRVILLTQNVDDIPFDLKHYPHIVYSGKITYLKTEIEKRIKWCIENPTEPIANVDFSFEILINGISWRDDQEIGIPDSTFSDDDFTDTYFNLEVGLHNISNTVIDTNKYKVGLLLPNIYGFPLFDIGWSRIVVDQQSSLFMLKELKTIFPDDWINAHIGLIIHLNGNKQVVNDLLSKKELTLKIFTELGSKECKFTLKYT